jgi:hypothetical protein
VRGEAFQRRGERLAGAVVAVADAALVLGVDLGPAPASAAAPSQAAAREALRRRIALLYGRMDGRYSRLERYAPLGRVLPRWQAAMVAVVGCGGLGGGLVLHLARMGVGSGGAPARLILIDRDTVGPENLGHQALFTEADAAAGLPKAVAAANAVAAVNSAVRVDAVVASLDRGNIRELLAGADLVFDGLDSYATRFLLNDYALATGTPYLYAGVVRGELSARAVCAACSLRRPPRAKSPPAPQRACSRRCSAWRTCCSSKRRTGSSPASSQPTTMCFTA